MLNLDIRKLSIWIPGFLILYNFCANLANDIYLPSLPKLVQAFDSSSATLQLTMTIWFAGVASPQLFFGPLTDRIGRRPVLLSGGLCFLISSIICALATNIWVLITARFFQGVGVCSLNVTTYGILSDLYNYSNRTKITNKINMCGTLAPLVGPIIGGYILTFFGWRANFIVLFLLGLVSIIGLWINLPESNLDLDTNALRIKNIYRNYAQLLNNKNFIKNLLPYCFLLSGLVAYLVGAPFIIIGELNISAEVFGYTQLPIFVAYVLGSIFLEYYINNEELIKKLSKIGLKLVFAGSLLMLITSYIFGNNLLVFILPMIIYGLGFSLCASPLVTEAMSVKTNKGAAAAFLGFGMAIGCMLSSLFLGLFYNGTITSIASLIFIITILAVSVYFLERGSAGTI